MRETLDVAAFLDSHRGEVLEASESTLGRTHLPHYDAAGSTVIDERLRALLEVVVESCRDHHLDAALAYADALAAERHTDGYPLAEVQTVINLLEESAWRAITKDLAPEDQGYALALVSTVLGRVKDAVACRYLALISAEPVRTLRIDSLFSGSEGSPSYQ